MSEGKPPAEAELQEKATKLKPTEVTVSSGGVDPAVLEIYKKAYAEHGGDKAKICEALALG
eukprot:CAMPEP_0168404006 /NCGR_PEP_ID=MMETSP0228-20121227/24418_1 /TAXON_ID=133427 /ORGANISM="Protoceratium reticulatum, Strain CCCM 535 (=CCMP 1889)" /LENGTH=60 /DNA_ID=CAMNT_0008417619 /DNA_START=95 /DNA_END=273 /DNA_ORIENTATION=-